MEEHIVMRAISYRYTIETSRNRHHSHKYIYETENIYFNYLRLFSINLHILNFYLLTSVNYINVPDSICMSLANTLTSSFYLCHY